MTAIRNSHPDIAEGGGGGDPSEGQWSQLEVLVAMLLDEARFARWENAMSRLGKGDKKPAKPEPTPRPGVKAKTPKPPLPPHVAEWLFAHMNGGASPDLISDVKAGEGVPNGVHQRR